MRKSASLHIRAVKRLGKIGGFISSRKNICLSCALVITTLSFPAHAYTPVGTWEIQKIDIVEQNLSAVTEARKVAEAEEVEQEIAEPPAPTLEDVRWNVCEVAKQYLGVPYVWGGTTPSGFDCSGLIQYVYGKCGYNVSRTTYSQVEDGIHVDKDDITYGDIVLFGDKSSPHHVGMYVGNGLYIHAPQTGDVVKTAALNNRNDICEIRRIIY